MSVISFVFGTDMSLGSGPYGSCQDDNFIYYMSAGEERMNIYEAVEKIIEVQKKTERLSLLDCISYKTEIADILQELLDTGGVADEYRDVKK